MEQSKSLFERWENGVGLGRAWWAFASAENRKRIRELQRKGEHLGLQLSLEDDLIARISAGELQAFGFEGGSNAGPVLIPQRYFWRKEEIDWDKEIVAAIGKKFHEVRVQGERELTGEWTTEPEPIDPWLIRKEPGSSDATLPSEPAPSNDPPARRETESAGEAPHKPLMGRPPLVPMVCEVIRELMSRDAFTGLAKWEIERLIRRKARERFPTSFPKPDRPTKNTINKALSLAGWPPPPTK
jgi:hypothetical protein